MRGPTTHGLGFANARTIRTLFERMLANQSNRLATDHDLSSEDLTVLQQGDVTAIATMQSS